ncbi:hypothetical protein EV363DRAFT_1113662, partial [Boletus edulis]
PETVLHFLLVCPHYECARTQLRHPLKRRTCQIATLLADPTCAKHALAYINEVGRFRQTQGDLIPPK